MAREQVGDVDQGAEPFNDSSKDPFGWYPEGSFLCLNTFRCAAGSVVQLFCALVQVVHVAICGRCVGDIREMYHRVPLGFCSKIALLRRYHADRAGFGGVPPVPPRTTWVGTGGSLR